jgi:hypothetical protein
MTAMQRIGELYGIEEQIRGQLSQLLTWFINGFET